jgi:hypothetical protein
MNRELIDNCRNRFEICKNDHPLDQVWAFSRDFTNFHSLTLNFVISANNKEWICNWY